MTRGGPRPPRSPVYGTGQKKTQRRIALTPAAWDWLAAQGDKNPNTTLEKLIRTQPTFHEKAPYSTE